MKNLERKPPRTNRAASKPLEEDDGDYRYCGYPRYTRIATLGPPLTCSSIFATELGIAQTVVLYPSFEDAAVATKSDRVEAFLAPVAYPDLDRFIQDPELQAVEEGLFARLPPLVLAGVYETPPQLVEFLYHHTATRSFLPRVEMSYGHAVEAMSNVEAARMAALPTGRSVAITNLPAAEEAGLVVYRTFSDGTTMPFILFTRAS